MWTLLAGSDEPNEITILKGISINESNIIYIRQIEIEQENKLTLHLKYLQKPLKKIPVKKSEQSKLTFGMFQVAENK